MGAHRAGPLRSTQLQSFPSCQAHECLLPPHRRSCPRRQSDSRMYSFPVLSGCRLIPPVLHRYQLRQTQYSQYTGVAGFLASFSSSLECHHRQSGQLQSSAVRKPLPGTKNNVRDIGADEHFEGIFRDNRIWTHWQQTHPRRNPTPFAYLTICELPICKLTIQE